MDFNTVACVCALELRRQKRKRKYWVHPLIEQRLLKGQFHKLHNNLRDHPIKFFNYYRMSFASFDELLKLIGPLIVYQDTVWRNAIPPEERLAVTLRYLATGNSFVSLHYEFLIGCTTIRTIVKDTCNVIWATLKKTSFPTKEKKSWLEIADKFYQKTNFPNCLGAVDGKHIPIQNPNGSGSQFYNYKNFFSVVLMAVVDAEYRFISVDIGSYGSSSDSHVFQRSKFGEKLENGSLDIPEDIQLPDEDGPPMLFALVGDEAFALSKHVLRPYGRHNLTNTKKIFNYRLSTARRFVECAFGIMANKWRILHRPLKVSMDFCDSIIKACCILHNYTRIKDGINFEDTLYDSPLSSMSPTNVRASHSGTTVRDYFAKYFTSRHGSVPWQYDKIA